jgi:hypothetical protein
VHCMLPIRRVSMRQLNSGPSMCASMRRGSPRGHLAPSSRRWERSAACEIVANSRLSTTPSTKQWAKKSRSHWGSVSGKSESYNIACAIHGVTQQSQFSQRVYPDKSDKSQSPQGSAGCALQHPVPLIPIISRSSRGSHSRKWTGRATARTVDAALARRSRLWRGC